VGERADPGEEGEEPVAQALVDRHRLKGKVRILDVGCGKGYLLREFKLLLPEAELVGFDISRHGLADAHPDVKDNLFRYRAQDRYPFGDKSFDLVVSLGTLHNLKIFELQTAIDAGERVVVGVNRFTEGEASPLVAGEGAFLSVPETVEMEAVHRLREWRARRDEVAVAATLGGFWNYEALQLQQLHKHPVVIPVDRAGVPTYDELVLVVREDEAHKRGEELRAFLQALTRGEHEVRADPAAAAALVVKANPSLDAKLQLASIEKTLPAAVPSVAGKPFGWQSSSAWASFGNWMFSHALLKHDPNTALPPFSNEFLPGQGI